ncbi:MarR family winged helix-turn-helix transcriptional regulator [Niallia nealsonii]|uniref:MarR family transcriptional regulator n=1 Tax=Niallia nealsonii TaxID=115979 RepID=A0A2N0YXR0_9BACI|nr:MarR family winged helix-turn-helix transcriptional regulator [Niallia nealsonii]PKG22047.1 MarR family transcriptional regulator [Niallia nealsonii]
MKDVPLGRLVSLIHRQNQKFLAKELKPYNLGNGGQYAFFKKILGQPGINQDELTSVLKFDKATTARAVKQLVEAGYIEKKIDKQDRRSNNLYPTAKAIDIYPAIQRVLENLNEEITKNFTEEEEMQLIRLLQKVYPE